MTALTNSQEYIHLQHQKSEMVLSPQPELATDLIDLTEAYHLLTREYSDTGDMLGAFAAAPPG